MSIARLLNRHLEVWRPTTTTDAGGGQDLTRVQMGTVPARISAPSGNEQTTGQASEAEITHDVYLLPGAPVRRGDELREEGLVLDVVSTVTPSKAVYLKAKCTSTESEGS